MENNVYLLLAILLLAGTLLTGCDGKNRDLENAPVVTEPTTENFSDVQEEMQEMEKADPDTFWTPQGYPDFGVLEQINQDIYAWLEITGTDISFPVLQSEEDVSRYLTHNIYGEEDENGCIYTEYCNSRDFIDHNTVVYGRSTPEMFGRLYQFRDRDFFDSHCEVKIYLQDRILNGRIFAAYTYDDRHLIATYDFSDAEVFENYLKDIFSIREMDAFFDTTVQVTAQDNILTLSTGVKGEPDRRYLVQAVLEEK